MRLGIIIFVLISHGIMAQNEIDSSLQLEEVAVVGHYEKGFLPGNQIIIPQKENIQFYKNSTLDQVLNQESNIYFKSYGSEGMLSTISFRGTNASQTSVLWNNFNINNYTLGLTDFSLIPNAAIGEINVIPGSGSAMGGNGAFGGAVLLNSQSGIQDEFISLNQSLGSFNTYQSTMYSQYKIGELLLSTRLYYKTSENNFTSPLIEERQKNASYNYKGFVQSLHYSINQNSIINADVWWHDNFREIQSPIGSNNASNDQNDENLRSQITYQYTGIGKLKIGTGYFQDEMIYRNGNAISNFNIKRLESYATYKRAINTQHQYKLSIRQNNIWANNGSYEGNSAEETRYSLAGFIEGKLFSFDLAYAFHLKQQIVAGVDIPVNPYLGFSKKLNLNENSSVQVRVNSSYNYRLPTLNDRYWQELGNPNLNAENAWNKEIGFDFNIEDEFNIQYAATLFHNDVDNWIQWIPDETGQFRPQNIKNVIAQGVENQLSYHQQLAEFKLKTILKYSYITSVINESNNEYEIGNQLIYTPQHKASVNFLLRWNDFEFHSINRYTGKVYTTSGNSEIFTLSPFIINDVGISWKQNNWTFSGQIKNLLNTSYQRYSGFATPGRNFQININKVIEFKNYEQ